MTLHDSAICKHKILLKYSQGFFKVTEYVSRSEDDSKYTVSLDL